VIDFIQYPAAKAEREAFEREKREWSNLPLASAMCWMEDEETAYWQQLVDQGLIKTFRAPVEPVEFSPVHTTGAPVSQTIIDERHE
jgi:hypothetical protein